MKLSDNPNLIDVDPSKVSIDTRTLEPGSLFFAIKGEHFDGHQFLAEAKAKGAITAVVSEQQDDVDLPQIVVDDTRFALGNFARIHRNRFDIPVIALTGSSGKTTTKEMIASILRQNGNVLASKGNFNNDIGAPLSLCRLSSEHDYAVFELGANHMHEIAYTANLVQPTVALITNIGAAHIEGFGSEEGVAKAKGEIYQKLAANGTAIINADDRFAEYFRGLLTDEKIYYFGMQNPADFTAKNITLDQQGHAHFILQSPAGEITIQLPLPGQHNVMNALAAAACACATGCDLEAIKAGLETVPVVAGRLIKKTGLHGATIIDDTYNANPNSVAVAIDLLSQLQGRRILVLGDMGELGTNAEFYHRQIGEKAKQAGIDACFTVGQLSQAVTQAFSGKARHFADKQSLINELQQHVDAQTVCLIKGSRSAKMEEVVAALVASQ